MSNLIKRRAFLAAAGATVAAACVPGAGSTLAFGPPETASIRIDPHEGCEVWSWVVEDLLREEGFTDIQITDKFKVLAGQADFGATFSSDLAARVDADLPIVAVGGSHTGCIQMWAQTGINSIRELKGKRIDVHFTTAVKDPSFGMWVTLLSEVGMSPSDVRFVEVVEPASEGGHSHGPTNQIIENFVGGKSDAVLGFVEQGPALRANPQNPGHLIFDMAIDRPWSQYYCCLLVANRDYANANPWATKRATRAVLRGIDIVMKDRKAAVDTAVRKGFTPDAKLMLAAIQPLNYPWRDYDPIDSLRYFSLKLADAKLLKKTPAQIIADGTDLTFFRQMQKELKA